MQYAIGCKNSIGYRMTREEFLGKIKAWDERTSTSLFSRVHLGHAKAYTVESSFPKKDETEPVTEEDCETESDKFDKRRDKIIDEHLVLILIYLED